MISCSPPASGGEHIEFFEKVELKMLEQRERLGRHYIEELVDRSLLLQDAGARRHSSNILRLRVTLSMTPSQHDGKPVGHIKFGEHVEFDDHDQRESREGEIGRERPHRTADYPSNQNRKGRESNQFPRKHHFPRPIRDGRNEHDYGNHTDEHHPLQVGVERTLREGNEEDSDNSPNPAGRSFDCPEQPLDVPHRRPRGRLSIDHHG